MELYIPTGNEVVSLPTINEETAAIESVSFLYMAQKGMIELRGNSAAPLMTPFVQQIMPDGRSAEQALTDLGWHREHDWITKMSAWAGDVRIDITILAPVGERGFALRLSVRSDSPAQVRFGLRGCWSSALHCVNEDKELEGTKHCYRSGWNNSIVFDFRCGGPLFALAPMADRDVDSRFSLEDGAVRYSLSCDAVLSDKPETVTFSGDWALRKLPPPPVPRRCCAAAGNGSTPKPPHGLTIAHTALRIPVSPRYTIPICFSVFFIPPGSRWIRKSLSASPPAAHAIM